MPSTSKRFVVARTLDAFGGFDVAEVGVEGEVTGKASSVRLRSR
jgi:hypothetical protein